MGDWKRSAGTSLGQRTEKGKLRLRVRVRKVRMRSRRTMRRRLDQSFRKPLATGWIELWQSTWASVSHPSDSLI